MNLEQAQAMLPFVGVATRDQDGKPIRMTVPAQARFTNNTRSGPRTAYVTITRKQDSVTLDCRIQGDGDAAEPEPEPCLGMENGHLCYHAIAAILAATAERGKLYIYRDSQKAHEYAEKRKGKYLTVQSAYSKNKQPGSTPAVFVSNSKPAPTAPKATSTPANQCKCGAKLTTPTEQERGLCAATCDQSTDTKQARKQEERNAINAAIQQDIASMTRHAQRTGTPVTIVHVHKSQPSYTEIPFAFPGDNDLTAEEETQAALFAAESHDGPYRKQPTKKRRKR